MRMSTTVYLTTVWLLVAAQQVSRLHAPLARSLAGEADSMDSTRYNRSKWAAHRKPRR